MIAQPIEQLNERQKQCLRLYFANLTIKEIGRELQLSPFTVRGHLRDARRVLGVHRSMTAARMLVEYERDTLGIATPERVGLEPAAAHEDRATPPAQLVAVVRNRYNLGILQRIGLIVAIAFISVALAGALLVGAEAITRIFVDYRIDISDPPYRK